MRSSFTRRRERLNNSGKTPSHEENLFSELDHLYRAYGLLFSSEVQIDHFPDACDPGGPDVRIRRGEIFGCEYKPPGKIQIEASPGRLLLRGARSATMLITGGNTIQIQPLPDGNPATIRQMLLGWALGGLFHQRAMLPLHGSAVCRGNDCFVFCAASGVGKSTLAAAFLNRGFSFLDDNIAVADFQEDTAFITPGSPELRLWEGSLPALEFEHRIAGRIQPDLSKVSIIAQRNFRKEKTPIRKIFCLSRSDESKLSFVNLTGAAKFQALMKNVFFLRYFKDFQGKDVLFHPVQHIAERVPMVEIRLTRLLPPPDVLSDTILDSALMS
jgi:hypothetical protein